MAATIELVGKIGSMALVDAVHSDVDYNKFARIGKQLAPGMVWVSSGAVEIGKLDYFKRNGEFLGGEDDEMLKTDYSAQGQAILMKTYRDFINSKYSVRQVLVEHQHFNDEKKRAHLKDLLLRCVGQNAVPIVNYNDCVSDEETRKFEVSKLASETGHAVELVDNDETAAQIANLVEAKRLVILTNTRGIYRDPKDANSLIESISCSTIQETLALIDEIADKSCRGASRNGANGATAKLHYIKPCVASGMQVYIASAEYDLNDIIAGRVCRTYIGRAND